ncbi:MAG: hypothetical protein ACSHYF_10760 [Verrucomicrobiaceae bacterium]
MKRQPSFCRTRVRRRLDWRAAGEFLEQAGAIGDIIVAVALLR